MSDNWVVQALQSAFGIWNDKLTEIWSLITTTPQEFHGGDIWNAIVGINEGLKAIGYGLLVLFFAMGVFQSAASFRDLQRPEYALRLFIRFIAAKVAVSSAMEIMTTIFSICGGVVQSWAEWLPPESACHRTWWMPLRTWASWPASPYGW